MNLFDFFVIRVIHGKYTSVRPEIGLIKANGSPLVTGLHRREAASGIMTSSFGMGLGFSAIPDFFGK